MEKQGRNFNKSTYIKSTFFIDLRVSDCVTYVKRSLNIELGKICNLLIAGEILLLSCHLTGVAVRAIHSAN